MNSNCIVHIADKFNLPPTLKKSSYFCIVNEVMEGEGLGHIVYSKSIIEFVTVANEYCRYIENDFGGQTRITLEMSQKLLPLLYLKTTTLPKFEKLMEWEVEKFVSEFEYNALVQKWETLLGENDAYPEVFNFGTEVTGEQSIANISEGLLDVYQILKDCLTSYSLGNEEVMNDALSSCILDFEEYWGQRLLNTLKAIHHLLMSRKELEPSENNEAQKDKSKDETGWVDGFFDQFRDENIL